MKPTPSELRWCLIGVCLGIFISPLAQLPLFIAACVFALFVLPALIGAGLGKLAGSVFHKLKPARIRIRKPGQD